MRIADVDEFLAYAISPDSDLRTAEDCLHHLDTHAMRIVFCTECEYSYQFHRDLFCKRLRRSGTPLTDMRVEKTGFCSEGRYKRDE